jgi:hypothetical protein
MSNVPKAAIRVLAGLDLDLLDQQISYLYQLEQHEHIEGVCELLVELYNTLSQPTAEEDYKI